MEIAAIIKHPGRDLDYRIDIMVVPDNQDLEELRNQLMREMLGPFEVIALTTKINFDRKITPKPLAP